MTKTIKKSLLCFLVFVTALMGIGAIATVPAKADDTELSANAQSFITLMDKDYTGIDTSVLIATETDKVTMRQNVFAAKIEYDKLTSDELGSAATTSLGKAITKFNSIWNPIFSLPVEVADYHNSTMVFMLSGNIKYSQKARFDNIVAIYNQTNDGTKLDDNQKSYVKAETTDFQYKQSVGSLFTAIENRASDAKQASGAKQAIDNIKFYRAGTGEYGSLVLASEKQDGDKIVVASLDSIKAAMNKINAIYDSYDYAALDGTSSKFNEVTDQEGIVWDDEFEALSSILTNIEVFDEATTAWNSLVDSANRVAQQISSVNSLVNGTNEVDGVFYGKTYKKNESTINAASEAFENLKNTSEKTSAGLVNDCTTFISDSKTTLDALKNGLDAGDSVNGINNTIGIIEDKITELKNKYDTVDGNGVYTDDCIDLIVEIRKITGYDTEYNYGESNVNDQTKIEKYVYKNAGTLIEDWNTFIAYEREYNNKVAAITALQRELKKLLDNDATIVESFTDGKNGAYDMYKALCDEQLSDFAEAYIEVKEENGVKTPVEREVNNSAFKISNIEVVTFGTYNGRLGLYEALQAKAKAASDMGKEFKNKVDALGEYEFSAAFSESVNALLDEWKTLPPAVQNVVVESKTKLDGFVTRFSNDLNKAKAWREKVKFITDGTIVIGDKQSIDGAMSEFGKLVEAYGGESVRDEISKLLENSAEDKDDGFATSYRKYVAAVRAMYGTDIDGHTESNVADMGIIDRIDSVATRMSVAAMTAAGVTAVEIKITDADYTSKVTAYNSYMEDLREAYGTDEAGNDYSKARLISNEERDYLQRTYDSEYKNYLKANEYYAQYHVEAAIINITANNKPITIASGEKELENPASYEGNKLINVAEKLLAEFVAAGNTRDKIQNLSALSEARNSWNNLAQQYQTWKDNVNKIIKDSSDAFIKVDDLTGVDLSNIKTLFEQYYNFVDTSVTETARYTFDFSDCVYKLDDVAFDEESETIDSDVVGYLNDEYLLLCSIQIKAFSLITNLTESMQELVDNFDLSENFVDLQELQDKFDALHDTQKKYDEETPYENLNGIGINEIQALLEVYESFSELYVNQTIANSFMKAVDSLYNAVMKPITIYMPYTSDDKYYDYENNKDVSAESGYDAWYNCAKRSKSVFVISKSNYELTLTLISIWDQLSDIHFALTISNDLYSEGELNYLISQVNGALADYGGAVKIDKVADYGDLLQLIKTKLDYGVGFEYFEKVIPEVIETLENDVYNSLYVEIESVKSSIETIENNYLKKDNLDSELKALLEKEASELRKKLNELYVTQGELTTLKGTYTGSLADLNDDISDINKLLGDWSAIIGDSKNYASLKDYLDKVIGTWTEASKLSGSLTSNIEKLNSDLTNLEEKLSALIKAEEDARKDADEKLAADIAANDKAINELLNSKVAGLNKTITIITVIFSVVMAGMIACTVILFLKKK